MFIKVERKEKRTKDTSIFTAIGLDGSDYSDQISFLTKRKAVKDNKWLEKVAHSTNPDKVRFRLTSYSLKNLPPDSSVEEVVKEFVLMTPANVEGFAIH